MVSCDRWSRRGLTKNWLVHFSSVASNKVLERAASFPETSLEEALVNLGEPW